MKLAIKAYAVTLILLMLVFAAPAQQRRSDKDPRNAAPTIGTGGAEGGPTGLFTIYDGSTLRKGEYTFSISYSNYNRDPGDANFAVAPISFQVGLSNRLEIFGSTEAWRRVNVNAGSNLSGFFLPNAVGGFFPAIVMAPDGGGPNAFRGQPVYRPRGMPFANFPYVGASAGNYNVGFSGPVFGFPAATQALLLPPSAGTFASFFPGVGSAVGSILPGVVFATSGVGLNEFPTSFSVAPTYLPDAPFIDRPLGESAWNSWTVGAKWRFNNPESAVGFGIVGFYKRYTDNANSLSAWNMMQRGSGPGANTGDFGGTFFLDARVGKHMNVSGNVGYVYTTNPKGTFGATSAVLLDRPDELSYGVGVDFPLNKHFQPMAEFRDLRYIRHQTPNALQTNPMEIIGGTRIFFNRAIGMTLGIRYLVNQQTNASFGSSTTTVFSCSALCIAGTTTTRPGPPAGFVPSSNPLGFMAQFFAGKRIPRESDKVNSPPSVNSVDLSATVINLPCGPGKKSRSGACNDNKTISVATHASDPDNDVLTYNYTVSGGRIVGTGANVQWDLSNAQAGTYTITTGVDDGCGVCGKTDTRTVKVQECPDCVQVCSCPTVSLSGPSGITNPGETMTFTASSTADVTYSWTVSAGTITAGQGTPSISVTAPSDGTTSVTATLEIGGTDKDCNCTTTYSETGGVAPKPTPKLVDEFGPQKDDEVKARVDNFFIQLNNDPNSRGYIINYGSAAEIKKRRAQIMKAVTFRKYDASRLTFVDGPNNGNGINTKFYIVPAGADNPTP